MALVAKSSDSFCLSSGADLCTSPEPIIVDVRDYTGPAFYPGEQCKKFVPILAMDEFAKKTNGTRTQFPLVAGFAMTINKSQVLTIKEGVVINLRCTGRFKPASRHGLTFVALTRSESFAMTAFINIPPFDGHK
jgi:hypothetical protein